MEKRNTILISGANGLLGRSVAKKLSNTSNVIALVHYYPTDPLINVNYIIYDLGGQFDLTRLPKKIDVIYHFAQSSHFRDFPNSALNIFMVNVNSTAVLLDYAIKAGVKHFIFTSSGGVYGTSTNAFQENSSIDLPNILGYYLGTKACGEILVKNYSSVFKVTVIRPFFIYGPRQNRSMLIPRLFDSVKNNIPIIIQGSDGIRINPIHVEDATDAAISVLNTNESTTFNIAGPEILSIRQITEAIGNIVGISPNFKLVDGKPKDLIADISTMKEFLIIPRISLIDKSVLIKMLRE